MHPGFVGGEGDTSGLLGADLHLHTVVDHAEAVGQILDLVKVGDDHGHLITLFDLEFGQAKLRCDGGHVHAYFIAIADYLAFALQVDAVCLGHGHGLGEEGVVSCPYSAWVDLVGAYQNTVVGLGISGAVMHQFHFLTGDVDQLIVFGMQRAYRQETVFGKLRQHHQPLAVGIPGFGETGVVMPRLVVDIELLTQVVDVFAIVVANGILNIPLGYLAIDEQRGIGIAPAIVGGVKRAQAQFRFTHDGIARFDTVVEQLRQLVDGDD